MRVAREWSSVQEAVDYYIDQGWHPIAGRPNAKIPANKDWKTTVWKQDIEVARFSGGNKHNVGLLLGKTCVDIDLDSPNSRRYAPLLLPKTLMLQKDGVVTHYLYNIPSGHDPIQTKQFTLPSNKMSCEMRGTDGSGSPQYTMVAPSTHPSGAKIEAVGPEPVTIQSGEWLFRQIRLVATCDLITAYWSDGSRHNLALGLSGFLAKNQYDEDTILEVIQAIGQITGDHEDRSNQVKATIRKWTNGGRIAGEQTLSTHLPKETFEVLKRWYSDQITRLEDYEIDEIVNTPMEERMPYLTYVVDADVFTTDGNHLKSNQIPLIFGRVSSAKEIASHMRKCNKVRGFGYYPNKGLIVKDGIEKYWNNWRPGDIQPKQGDVKRFLDHVSSLCDGEQESIKALLGYAAHAVKKPEEKVRWMPILVGGEGSFKTTFCDILGALVGRHNYASIPAGDMLGNFTGAMQNKLIVSIEEMRISHKAQGKALANALKEKITNDTMTIKIKYVNDYQVANVVRFIGLSNFVVMVEMSGTDRRYYPIVSKTAVKNSGVTVAEATNGWGQGYHHWLYNEDGLEAILHYLLDYDTNMFDPNHAPIQSSRQKEIKRMIQDVTTAPDRSEEIYDVIMKMSNQTYVCEISDIRRMLTESEGLNNISNRMIGNAMDYFGLRRIAITKNTRGSASKRYNLCVLVATDAIKQMSDREVLTYFLNETKTDF